MHYMHINNSKPNKMSMRTKAFLWMSLLLLSLTCLSSCSSDDDDDNNVVESEIIGTWYMVGASYAWGDYKEYNEGEITITFTNDGKMQVVNTSEDQNPFATGTHQYYLTDIKESMYYHGLRPCISWGGMPYSYIIKDGILELEAEACDATVYTLKRK